MWLTRRTVLSARTAEIPFILKPLWTTAEAIGRRDISYAPVRPDAFTHVHRPLMVFEHMLYCAEVNAVADDVDALRTTTVQGVCSGLNNKKKDWDRNA